MNFRINQGVASFTDNKLGMSSASRLRNSFRSKRILNQKWEMMKTILEKYNLCCKMKEKNLEKLNKSFNMIWIVSVNLELSFKTN